MGANTGIVGTVVESRVDLEDLYVRHTPAAIRVAFLITGDADLAQDIAQEAFLRAVGRFRHLRQPEAFEAYLRRSVVNACTSHFRHRKVEAAYVRREGKHFVVNDNPILRTSPSPPTCSYASWTGTTAATRSSTATSRSSRRRSRRRATSSTATCSTAARASGGSP